MAELAALNVKITGDASGIKAAANSASASVEKFTKSAESSAKVFERAFAQNERSVDRLRRAIDPVYASSKKYESAVNTLDKALKQGNITQAAHARMLEQAGAAYLRAGSQAGTATAAMGRFGAMSALNRSRVQNLGFQLQDMAIQFQAGTRASVVFAQQGSQIASIFGPVGAIIGTLAAVGIPLLAFAFSNGAEKGQKFEDALSSIRDMASSLEAQTKILNMTTEELADTYGAAAEVVRNFAIAQSEAMIAQAERRLADQILVMDGLITSYTTATRVMSEFGESLDVSEQIRKIQADFKTTGAAAAALQAAFTELDNAATFDQQQAALQKIDNLIRESGISYRQIPPALNDALIQMRALVDEAFRLEAQANKTALAVSSIGKTYGGRGGDPRKFMGGNNSFGGSTYGSGTGTGTGTGGGAASNPVIAQLDALRQSLLTAEEAQIASYQRQQETLAAALEQRLITQQEYQALMEDAQRQHSERMAQIDAYRYGDTLQKAGAFFGDMASAFQSGNEKMAAIGKKFAAIEALINAWRAYNQTLADPSLPFFAKFAAAASVLAAGMNAVQAIKGSGGGAAGGAGGVSAAANTPAAPSNSTYFNVSLTGGNNYGGEQIRDLIAQINQAIEDGAVIRGIRIA